MKKFIIGASLALAGLCYFVPGEIIVQIGFRKMAIEQGFAMAARHWSFDGAPEAENMQVAELPKATKKKK